MPKELGLVHTALVNFYRLLFFVLTSSEEALNWEETDMDDKMFLL